MSIGFIIIGALGGLLGLGASFLTKTTFNKYSRVSSASGLTGAEAARSMLDKNGLQNVTIERVQGFLSDHYDPRSKVLRLSPPVHDSNSLSAIGVACHEAGHALQDAQDYTMLNLRSKMVPVTQIGSQLSMPIIIAGSILGSLGLFKLGIILFGLTVLFALVTLPVEWDASARAKRLMVNNGIVTPQEQQHAGRVLNAAFLTYLASAVTAILYLLFYLWRAGIIGGRRN